MSDTDDEPDDERDVLVRLAGTDNEPGALRHLHETLVGRAQREDLLDVAYTVFDSPVGSLLLAATPRGLVRVAFGVEDHDQVLEALAERVSPRILRAPARLEATVRELDEYFSGTRTAFDVALDRSLSHGFRRVVQELLPSIGFGQTLSYGELARRAGNPGASRAVGTACATNPLPVVVPCHRVLRADGQVGGYVGGEPAKTRLLALEAAA